MAVSPRPLWTAAAAPTSQTTMYTATGLKCILDKLTVSNPTAGALTYAVNLVPNGGSAGASNLILTKSLAAGETYTFPEIIGHVLESGGFISVIASSTSLIHRASGREVT